MPSVTAITSKIKSWFPLIYALSACPLGFRGTAREGSQQLKPQHTHTHTPTNWQGQSLGILGLFALLSFTWLPNSYTLMVSWPYCLWWQGAFLLLVSWSIWISRQFPKPLSPLGHQLDWIVLLIALGNALSTLNAQFRLVAGTNFLLLSSYGIVLYLTVTWLRQSPQLKMQLWLGLALTGTLTHIISLTSWRPTTEMWSTGNFYTAIRNPFPLGHHNFVGGYCLLMLPIIVGVTLSQTNWRRWLGYGAIALNLIALYASGSRGALVGALALGTVALPFYVIHHPPKTRKHWIISGLLSLALIGAVLSNPRIRDLATINPAANHNTFSIEQIDDGPTKDRIFMLQAGQRIFKAHPLLGIGPGNLARVYNLYRPLETGSGLELVQQLHNTPAQILAELGLIGFSGYLLWLGWLLKLGISLHRHITDTTDRILLYSIGSSWFAYGISSLTDYQLENIGIASTLIITSALLIYLADIHLSQPTAPQLAASQSTNTQPAPKRLSQSTRRFLSLGLLLYLSILIQTWARIDAALYISAAAQKDSYAHNLADADSKWLKASQLVPWDPTYAALSSDQLIDILKNTNDSKNREALTTAAIASLKTALQAAPNDPWFNQNLAVLLLSTEPKQAESYSRRTALLAPRSKHYTYYTLGCTYLKQEKYDQAITAFTLEAIANPKFLVDPLWNQTEFSTLLPDVVVKTISAWQQILTETAPDSNQYAWLNQQLALVQWWYPALSSGPPPAPKHQGLPSFIQAILQAESNPNDALSLLNETIESDLNALLLKTWIKPEQYLSTLLKDFNGTSEEVEDLTKNIRAHPGLRQWLTSISQPIESPKRYGLAFAYRNGAANNIRNILFASGSSSSLLLEQLALFPPPPREFSQLDRKITEIGTQSLSLIPPSQIQFSLPKP